MLDQNGEFAWEMRNLYQGMRQDQGDSVTRATVLKNIHLFKRGSWTKRRGFRRLNTVDVPANPDIWAGFDAHFNDGTQKVVAVAGTDAYVFSSATRSFAAQSLSLASARPDLLMFADELILCNGTDTKRYSGSAWNSLGGSPPAGAYGAVHANRLILVDPTLPYFYYSGVRNANSWNTSNDYVTVTGSFGEVITAAGQLGPFLIIGTRFNTIAYLQNAGNPGDWDRNDISGTIGPVNNASFLEVEHLNRRLSFFWSPDGPMVLYQSGGGIGMKPLWEPTFRIVQGNSDAPMEGLETARYSQVVTGYQQDIQEVRFGVPQVGVTENNCLVCYDLASVLQYIDGGLDQPKVTIKDNVYTDVYPCEALFSIRVGSSDGLPSTSGRNRLFGGRDGVIYELDVTNADNGQIIPLDLQLSGLSGAEDGVGDFQKVVNRVKVRGTQNSAFALTAQVSADGGASAGSASLSLNADVGVWGDGGVYTDDPAVGQWNAATVKQARGDVGVYGRVFSVRIQDAGSINADFEMSEVVLEGQVFERQ